MQKNTLALITLFSLAVGGCHGKGKAEPFEFGKIYLYSSHKDLNNPQLLPTENLPGRKLIDRYPELLQRQLLNRKLQLRPELRPWASTFFPTWFGGVSGRWQDSKVRLVLRTLWGSQPLTSFEAEELLEKSSRGDSGAQDTVYGLSPTEKYDYAVGDYSARSTREESLVRGHNSPNMLLRQPFWMGYCNGVALASMRYAEPFREVDVVNPDGHRIRFHPNDIKGLLSLAHSHPSILHWQVGWRCEEYDTSSLACNDINPASLVIVLANRIGLAHESLVVDQNPLAPVINNAVRSAEITVLQPPYTVSDVPDVAEQLEVRIDLEVASTLLSTDAANVRDAGNGVFKHVEDGNVRLSYQATLALDANAKIIGGRWTGRKLSGPDFVWGARGDSASDIAVHDHLDARPQIRYSVLEALHAKSVSIEPGIPQLDITQVIPNNQTEMFSYYTGDAKIRVHGGRYIRILGRLSGEFLHSAKHMNCTVGADDQERPEDMQVLNFEFTRLNRHGKFLDYDLVTEVKREGANRLKCNFYGPGPDQKLARLAYAHATVIYP